MAKDKHISLKEAAELSGYSADYVGQLIRNGKIEGKQVFSNVAWVTTEDAVRTYIERQKSGAETRSTLRYREMVVSALDLEILYKVVLGGAIAFFGVCILFLIYIFSVSVDHRIDQTYEQQAQQGL